jgi:hypothetical protein
VEVDAMAVANFVWSKVERSIEEGLLKKKWKSASEVFIFAEIEFLKMKGLTFKK